MSLFTAIVYYYDMYVLYVFCKQKSAYVMRISDWSSDVCSSDLEVPPELVGAQVVNCAAVKRRAAGQGHRNSGGVRWKGRQHVGEDRRQGPEQDDPQPDHADPALADQRQALGDAQQIGRAHV